MDTNTAMAFIDKAVQKTKSKDLNWNTLSSTFKLKPLHNGEEIFDFVLFPSYSYCAKYKTGYLLLLLFSDNTTKISPPNGSILSLRVQEETSSLAIEITNSQFDPVDSAGLIRLYNLLDANNTHMDNVNSLVKDFLNS